MSPQQLLRAKSPHARWRPFSLAARSLRRDIARFRATWTADAVGFSPTFLILIVNAGSHAERWYRLYGERSKRVYIAYCRSTWNQKPNATSCNPPNPPNVTNKTRKSNLKPTPANARETRNPKPMGGANYTGKWQDKDGRAGRGRPKWTFRARSARPSQSPAGHREF